MVLVLGDVHGDDAGNRSYLQAAYDDADESVAVQVGDLLTYALPMPTWFIAGNNEDFDVIEALRRGERPDAVSRHVTLLASTGVELEGVRFAGLSGNFAPTQFEKSRAELTGDRRRHFTHEDIAAFEDVGEVDVLLTHEAPHGLLTSERYDVGCTHIDSLLRALEPDRCYVGHHHEHAESRFGPTKVVSLAPIWEGYYTLRPRDLMLEFRSWENRRLDSITEP